MHQALFIFDILFEIFAHLKPIRDSFEVKLRLHQSCLAALARTCKTFYEPAMDLLWSDMFEIRPFLGCVSRLRPVVYSPYWVLSCNVSYRWPAGMEPLSEHEIRQFLRHASRVRSLVIAYSRHLSILRTFPPETCLFPKLLVLKWHPEHTRYLPLFMSPSLRHCDLQGVCFGFEPILTCCPVLQTLFIAYRGWMPYGLSLLSDTVRSCTRLVALQVPYLEFAVWKHLSKLSTLLTVEISRDVCRPMDCNDLDFAPFLNLTVLSFYARMTTDIITIVRHSEFPSLKEFKMRVDYLPWAEAEQLFHALSQCKAHRTLQSISIYSSDQGALESPSNFLTVIRYFFCFKQLHTLQLRIHFAMHLDNDFLLEAMSNWPRIYCLELWDSHRHSPTITFRGLLSALSLRPYLGHLCVPLDLVNIDIDPKVISFQHTYLHTFGIRYSHVADPEAVAQIISAMLPRIREVGSYGDESRTLWDFYIISVILKRLRCDTEAAASIS